VKPSGNKRVWAETVIRTSFPDCSTVTFAVDEKRPFETA
jgi:hypothetical protein